MIFQIKCQSLIIPKKSKLQLKVQKTLLKVNCISSLPEELNDSKLNSLNNKKIENEPKFTENIDYYPSLLKI